MSAVVFQATDDDSAAIIAEAQQKAKDCLGDHAGVDISFYASSLAYSFVRKVREKGVRTGGKLGKYWMIVFRALLSRAEKRIDLDARTTIPKEDARPINHVSAEVVSLMSTSVLDERILARLQDVERYVLNEKIKKRSYAEIGKDIGCTRENARSVMLRAQREYLRLSNVESQLRDPFQRNSEGKIE